MKVHEKIRFMRQSKNWSQDEMAEKLEMSVNGYAKIEQGKTDAHISKLEQIAEIFEMNIVELLALGEKNVFFLMGDNSIGNNSINMLQVTDVSKELAFEIQKLQLQLEHKNELLAQKDSQIAKLEKIIALMENQAAS
jgi:transcriptional regulator with XRE-family HTH domain